MVGKQGQTIALVLGLILISGSVMWWVMKKAEIEPILPGPEKPAFQVNTYVEAEDAHFLNDYVLIKSDPTCSGGKYIETPDDPPITPLTIGPWDDRGVMKYKFEIPADGTYYLWILAKWTDGQGNSYACAFDVEPVPKGAGDVPENWKEDPINIIGQDTVYGEWHWVNKDVSVNPGTHTLVFQTREDGVALDQLILSSDPTFTP